MGRGYWGERSIGATIKDTRKDKIKGEGRGWGGKWDWLGWGGGKGRKMQTIITE